MLGGSFVAIHESINYMYSVIYYKLIQLMWAQCVLAVLFCSSREMKNGFFSADPARTQQLTNILYILITVNIMSVLSKDSVKIIAETVGINTISEDVATHVSSDAEYRLREIIQVRDTLQ